VVTRRTTLRGHEGDMMKFDCLPVAAALLLAVSLLSAEAQTVASPPISGASAVPAAKPIPRPLSPTELRDSASQPGDLRPEDPIKPQISIPLGKKPPTGSKLVSRAEPRSPAASAGGVNDASARCEAEADEQVRVKCRDKLAHTARSR
jgi:hypothetical protein